MSPAAAPARMQPWPAINPATFPALTENFAGRAQRRYVANLGDDELGEALVADLALVKRLAKENGFELDRATGVTLGPLDPKALHLQHLAPEVRAVNAASQRALAAREEMRRRAAAAQSLEAAKVQDARTLLESTYNSGPAAVRAHVQRAGEVVAAVERLRAIARDLELVAAASRLWKQGATLRAGIERAADALGKPVPEIEDMPEQPDAAECDYLALTLADGNMLREASLPSIGCANKVDAAARTLRRQTEDE